MGRSVRFMLAVACSTALLSGCAGLSTGNQDIVKHSLAAQALADAMNAEDAMPALFDQLLASVDLLVELETRDAQWASVQKIKVIKMREQWTALVQAQRDRAAYDAGAVDMMPSLERLLLDDRTWEIVDQLLDAQGSQERLDVLNDIFPVVEEVLRE